MAQKNDIILRALYLLGWDTEIDLTDTTDHTVKIINKFYDSVYATSITRYPWEFSKKYAELTLLANTDTNTKYEFKATLPNDCLAFLHAFLGPERRLMPDDIQCIGNTIYAHTNKLYIEYQYAAEETAQPTYFTKYHELYLAYNLCETLTGDPNKESMLQQKSEYEYLQAKNTEFRSKGRQKIKNSPFTSAHIIG